MSFSDAEIEQFMTDGDVVLRRGFSREAAAEGQAFVWRKLALPPDDPAAWHQRMIHVRELFSNDPFDRENTFTSATIEVAENQKVVSTGPYGIVRHPMYASASLYLLGTPLALGSYWGIVPIAAMMPFLIWRLFDEERFLSRNLPGYAEYQKRVRHRLVPFVW